MTRNRNWIAHVYSNPKIAKYAFKDYISKISTLEKVLGTIQISHSEMTVETDCEVIYFTTSNPENIRGYHFNKVIVHEDVSNEAYSYLASMLFFNTTEIERKDG